MKLAIVFSGGGARGAYQIGAWKALKELNIKASIAVGTSTGSITAALYVVNNLNKAIKVFENLSVNNIFASNRLGIKKDPVNLRKLLTENINYECFIKSNIDYGLITTRTPRMKKVEVTKKDLTEDNYIEYIIASCTIPVLFKKAKIDNKKYIDGGAKDAVPVSLAEKLGADKIIIINTSVVGRKYQPTNDKYIMIKPSRKIISPIKFDAKESKKLIELGYNDTMNALKDIKESFYE